jgi:hypothetical protein
LYVGAGITKKANQGSNPGSEAEEKNEKSGNDQFEKKKAQTNDEPKQFRPGKNVCDHNE